MDEGPAHPTQKDNTTANKHSIKFMILYLFGIMIDNAF